MLDQAEFVHFGFEGPDRVKIYLELGRAHPKDGAEARTLIHLAAKWRPNSDEAPAVSRYFNPAMARTVSGAEHRLGTLFANGAGMPSVALARAILMKLVRTGAQDCFFFMEVEDEGAPRLSFDLNIYPAELAVADFEGAIRALLAAYHVPVPASEALLAASRAHAFGHVSGGLGRRGVDFTTIYYGMRPHRGRA
ncbi:hypothetical protein NGM99_07445 [Mesorhizobium sp. RP14(2022)]|uniref:Uncharacterized protein n=1 Tax=Mesorhizobium liriopis TaxID=2953882 RepID=A0ABT1C463_9HYPH|nr:hypothetical protein [Mesorhizobium liriopis]MCO6049623.1 hypothetical protein [Mesorhizobium liriopis]